MLPHPHATVTGAASVAFLSMANDGANVASPPHPPPRASAGPDVSDVVGGSSSIYDASYPRQYVAYKSQGPPTSFDGDLTKDFWEDVPWTEDFVDIATSTAPKFRTRVKMRWDDEFLYVGAWMEETDVWGTLTEHNSVVFHDNDFEVFVDPGGTNHNYKEFEINALGTTWSLSLDKPYDDGGQEDSGRVRGAEGFDMEPPLRSAVAVSPPGAVNTPDVRNQSWSVEIALPLDKLMDKSVGATPPADGVLWRVNFSRVQWGVRVNEETGRYEKSPACQSCEVPGSAAEDNWVWSPQGRVAMHLPERWGIVQFSTASPSMETPAMYYREWPSRAAAMSLYYAEHAYFKQHSKFTKNVSDLLPYFCSAFPMSTDAELSVTLTEKGFDAKACMSGTNFVALVNERRFLTVQAMKSSASEKL